MKTSFNDGSLFAPIITLGTTSGSIFCYSIAKGDLDFTIKGNNLSIACISWCEGALLFTGDEQTVICWDIEKRRIKRYVQIGLQVHFINFKKL